MSKNKWDHKRQWKYRRVTFTVGESNKLRLYGIREIFYKKGKIDSHSKEPVLNYLNERELNWALRSMAEASKEPIIDLDNFPNEI